jgi:hypothetical protein
LISEKHPRNNNGVNLFNHGINLSIQNTTTTADKLHRRRKKRIPADPTPAYKKGEKYNLKKTSVVLRTIIIIAVVLFVTWPES